MRPSVIRFGIGPIHLPCYGREPVGSLARPRQQPESPLNEFTDHCPWVLSVDPSQFGEVESVARAWDPSRHSGRAPYAERHWE